MLKNIKFIIKLLLILAIIYVAGSFYIAYNYPIKYEKIIDQVCGENNVDKSLVLAIIKTESGFDVNAISKKKALGLMQVIPETIQYISQKYSVEVGINDIFDPEVNIEIGTLYIKNLIERFGSTDRAILAYNAGPSVVKKWIENGIEDVYDDEYKWVPYEETRNYIKRVHKARKGYQFLIEHNISVPQTLQNYFIDFLNEEDGFAKQIKNIVKGILKWKKL